MGLTVMRGAARIVAATIRPMWPGGIARWDATLTMASSGSVPAFTRSTMLSSASRSFASPYLVIFGIVLGIRLLPP